MSRKKWASGFLVFHLTGREMSPGWFREKTQKTGRITPIILLTLPIRPWYKAISKGLRSVGLGSDPFSDSASRPESDTGISHPRLHEFDKGGLYEKI